MQQNIPRITAPSDLSQTSIAIVIGTQIFGVPAVELGDAYGFQPLDSDLTAIAALATTSFGRNLLTLADAAAGRTAFALGTAATQNTGTSGANVPLLNGTNIWGGVQTLSAIPDLTSGGIKFPGTQVQSADANTLDDYEEGTFTPVVSGGTTAGAGTYSTQTGSYTKIGNRVLFELELNWSAHTGTGVLNVTGLPFTLTNVASFSVYWESLTYSSTPEAVGSVTTILIRQNASGAGATGVTLDTAARLIISGQYRTSG